MAPASTGLSRAEVALRAGVPTELVDRLIDERVLVPGTGGTLSIADVRRVGMVHAMLDAGLPLAGLGEGMRRGILSLDFADQDEYARFGALSTETFAQASARTGVPVEQLLRVREATGGAVASANDLVREHELPVIGFVESQIKAGFRPFAIDRLLGTVSDSLRRVAEAEAEWWRSEVVEPNFAKGLPPSEISGGPLATELSDRAEQALLAIWHVHESQTWTANIVQGFERVLTNAGLHQSTEQPPAICFLDITGYTRLTQERGDHAAADLAETLNRLVKRSSVQHGGRPIKWLGDGVMCHFPDPGPGVVAALDMVDGIVGAGLPPAHVGLHAGPIVIQEGDYYGQTVNLAARIAEYARPGEVLVSDSVVRASNGDGIRLGLAFEDIGEIELKGVAGAVRLAAARRSLPAA
jgi:adenylate cyclase